MGRRDGEPAADTRRKYILTVAFSLDGTQLASGSLDSMIKLWDVATGSLQRTLKDSSYICSVAFSDFILIKLII